MLIPILKLQDVLIMETAKELDAEVNRVVSHTKMNSIFATSFTPAELEAINANPLVDFPLVYTESARTVLKINHYFVDPKADGDHLKLHDWLLHWLPFLHLSFEQENETASLLMGRALASYSALHGSKAAQSFIDRLWRHRWILDSSVCARWRISVLSENQELLRDMLSTGDHAAGSFNEVESLWTAAKESAHTLDEWIEELYNLAPIVKYSRFIHEASEVQSEDAQRRQRFLEEISADIYAVYNHAMIFGVFLGIDQAWTQTFLPDSHDNQSPDAAALKRRLSYFYRARTMYPRFWFEMAVKFLIEGGPRLPNALDEFSRLRLTSCLISENPEAAHRAFKAFSFSKEDQQPMEEG
jgi:hypothetical protein